MAFGPSGHRLFNLEVAAMGDDARAQEEAERSIEARRGASCAAFPCIAYWSACMAYPRWERL